MHRYHNTYFDEPAEPHYPRVSHQHTQTVRYECSKCDSLFTSRLYLHQHEATVHDVILLCPFCPALFSNKSDFQTHVEAHTEKKHLPCSFCKKEFDEREEYEAHLKEHLEPCLFPCDFCPALFAQYSMLRAHNAIHVQKKFIHTISEKLERKRKRLSKKILKKLKSRSQKTATRNEECQTENHQPAESAVSVDAETVASNPVVDSLPDDDEGIRSGPRSAANSNHRENIRSKRKSLSEKVSKKLKSSSHETATHNQECQTENHQLAESAVSVDAEGVASNPVVDSLPADDEGIRSGPQSAANSNQGKNIRKRGCRSALNSNHGKNKCKRECRLGNESSRRSDASVSTSVPTFNNSPHDRRSRLEARKTAKKILRQNSCCTQTRAAKKFDDEIPETSVSNNVAEKHSETDVHKKLRPRNTLKILNGGFSLSKPKVNCTYNFRRRVERKSVYDESTSPMDDEVEKSSSSRPSSSSHANSSKGFFMCLSCKRVFLTYMLLNQHKDLHLEKKGSRCNKCGGLFGGPGNLAAHKRSSLCVGI